MSKAEREIEYPATHVVYWPGQEVMACEKHLEQLHHLNGAMGGDRLSSRRLLASEAAECSNCVNAIKAALGEK